MLAAAGRPSPGSRNAEPFLSKPVPHRLPINIPLKNAARQRRVGVSAIGADFASIAPMYIGTACRGIPLTPMPPVGGILRFIRRKINY